MECDLISPVTERTEQFLSSLPSNNALNTCKTKLAAAVLVNKLYKKKNIHTIIPERQNFRFPRHAVRSRKFALPRVMK